jgi:hypothetical protein
MSIDIKKLVKELIAEELRALDLNEGYSRKLTEQEVMLASGEYAPWGSQEHIDDLKATLQSLTLQRSRSQRRSAARTDYTRAIARLRSQLKAAERYFEKKNESNTGTA